MGRGKRASLFLAGLTGAAIIGTSPAGRAGAEGASSFTALAVAQANRVTFVAPGFLALETLADGGAPVSQAQLTAAGGRAFASTVYPGDTATHLEQLTGAAGMPTPPAYPLYVEAAHPDRPKAEAGVPGQQMTAEAAGDFAAGRASLGVLPSGADDGPALAASLATSRVDAKADGSVVARAESVVEGASFPGSLRIARIDSVAVATLVPGAASPTVETTTTVTGIEVGGTAVEIGPDGITRPQPAGLPTGTLSPVEESLAQAGISIRRVSGGPIAGGGSADVIEIRSTGASPAPGVPATRVFYRLGGATASVISGGGLGVGQPLPSPAAEVAPPPAAAPQEPARADPTGHGQESSSTPPLPVSVPADSAVSAGVGFGAASTETPVGAAQSAGPESVAAPVAAPGPTAVLPARVGAARPAADLRAGLGLLNLVLILGGLAAFAFSSIFRTKGVRATWNS